MPTINLTAANDTYTYPDADALRLIINGLGGNDTITTTANSGRNAVTTRGGNDTITTGTGDDTINAGNGNNTINAGDGNNVVNTGAAGGGTAGVSGDTAGTGDDTITTLAGNDAVNAGNGNNTVSTGAGIDTVITGVGNDGITTDGGRDTIRAGAGDDTIDAGAGNDVLRGMAGDDRLNGGSGDDWAYYNGAASAVTVSLANTGAQQTGGAGLDTLSAIENLLGSSYNDTLAGNGAGNRLKGAAGNDLLNGQGGNDTLGGGTGADRFVFDSALSSSTNVDRIMDFAANDIIRLDDDIFTALAQGTLGANAFRSGAGVTSAQDASDRIIYNSDTGRLFYDANGEGGADATLFAILTGAPVVTAADFFVSV